MSGFEAPYKSLLQGVSQQIPKLRLDGQVTAQSNMLSDIVTNVRRRPGLVHVRNLDLGGETYETVRAWETDIGGIRVNVVIGCALGQLVVLDETMGTILGGMSNSYLIAPKISDIRATTIGSEFYLLNVTKKPEALPPSPVPLTPNRRGFFFIKAGAFSKDYTVQVKNAAGTVSISFTTPTGTNPGDAALSTPDAIANSLVTGANLTALTGIGVTVTRVGATVYLESVTETLTVSTASGSTYLQPSGSSRVRLEADLPSVLPSNADGYIVAVGEQKLYKYYQYKAATAEWLESGVYGSPAFIVNMPLALKQNTGGFWILDATPYEGRTAGDDDTNPLPEFLTRGLSGMGAFQSRLVLLGGSKVYLSSSVNPRRFMRSTVTGLLDADPIAVGASANSSAEYKFAVPFQKDLLLFSEKYQALIPSSGQAVTPRTATVLLTSSLTQDVSTEPVPIGRTLLFPAPRSRDFFGLMEMVSSQYTDAQYVSNDATAHLPKYMGGKCRFAVSSPTASMVLFGMTADPRSVIVYEYQWDGDTKVQQSWHMWTFQYDIAVAYFSGNAVNFIFMLNGKAEIATMDPKQGVLTFAGERRPYMDHYAVSGAIANRIAIPATLLDFDPLIGPRLAASISKGPLAGERVGIESYDPVTQELVTVPSFPEGEVWLGIRYRSSFVPTPPMVKDKDGIKIESNKFTVLRFGVSTQNSAAYEVLVTDVNSTDPEALEIGTLSFSSPELEPGEARDASQSRAIVPARTEADSTVMQLYTDDVGEMNFTGIDYVGRYHRKLRGR